MRDEKKIRAEVSLECEVYQVGHRGHKWPGVTRSISRNRLEAQIADCGLRPPAAGSSIEVDIQLPGAADGRARFLCCDGIVRRNTAVAKGCRVLVADVARMRFDTRQLPVEDIDRHRDRAAAKPQLLM